MLTELENFQQEILDSEGLVILEVYTPSCVPCKKVLSVLEPISKNLRIIKANASVNDSLVQELNIRSVPTILFYIDGELDDAVIGSDITEILTAISKYSK